jgi:hypothetical protein
MAHANPSGGTTLYIDENVVIPEDYFDPDGWPVNTRLVGPGASLVVDIDSDQ